MNNLEVYANEIHKITVDKGFWDNFRPVDPFPYYAYKLAMIHSEVTEVMEAIRKDKGDDEVVEELADIIIRVLDFYIGLKEKGEIADDFDLDEILMDKIEINRNRPQRHGVRG